MSLYIRCFLSVFLVFAFVAGVNGHPTPDIPVRAYFESDGSARIQIEVDLRLFDEKPEEELYLQSWTLKKTSEKEKVELIAKAAKYIKKVVEFRFEPLGSFNPEFKFSFTTLGGEPFKKLEDPLVLTGIWETTVPSGIQGYQIKALPEGEFSVMFVNTLKGEKVERFQSLFPGEDSFILDLSGIGSDEPTQKIEDSVGVKASAGDRWATFVELLRQGFVHVVPLGWDHILFVLGLFLLSREWKPLLLQVTTFTLAHTITLGLATLGHISVSGSVVEPIIAASIAVVALENIFRPKYTNWRLLVVFFFGLIHGLGFAGALSELELAPGTFVVGLVGFNVGVEFGQITVILIAIALTFWIKDAAKYRKFIVVPCSIAIALMGAWWTIERVFL